MRKNALFRGCTRPPMFLGVPYIPFFIAVGAVLLLAMYTNLFFLVLLPAVIFVMRQMARRDELIFRLLALHWQYRLRIRNVRTHDGMWIFSPNLHREKPAEHR